jgi:hypothetical protein
MNIIRFIVSRSHVYLSACCYNCFSPWSISRHINMLITLKKGLKLSVSSFVSTLQLNLFIMGGAYSCQPSSVKTVEPILIRLKKSPQTRTITSTDFDLIWQWMSQTDANIQKLSGVVEALRASSTVLIYLGFWVERIQKCLQDSPIDQAKLIKRLAMHDKMDLESFRGFLSEAYDKWLHCSQQMDVLEYEYQQQQQQQQPLTGPRVAPVRFIARPQGDLDLNDWTPELLAHNIVRHYYNFGHTRRYHQLRPITSDDYVKICQRVYSRPRNVELFKQLDNALLFCEHIKDQHLEWVKDLEKCMTEKNHEELVKALARTMHPHPIFITHVDDFKQNIALCFENLFIIHTQMEALDDHCYENGTLVLRPQGNYDISEITPEVMASDIIRHFHNCKIALDYK